jgi:hypothetical protein
MEKIFAMQRDKNQIILFNLKDIDGLKKGDIFFRRNKNNTTEILQDFVYLDKEYLDNIIDKLSEEEQYGFSLLESKSI